ncbi:Excalibur calcium-binding domain containing protein [Candidatus Nanopelagicaceae bacterium]
MGMHSSGLTIGVIQGNQVISSKSRKLMRIGIILMMTLVFMVSPENLTFAASKVFQNCTELNKIYPGGVALPGAVNNGGVTKKTPKISKALYLANQKSDRDKDGIACEK